MPHGLRQAYFPAGYEPCGLEDETPGIANEEQSGNRCTMSKAALLRVPCPCRHDRDYTEAPWRCQRKIVSVSQSCLDGRVWANMALAVLPAAQEGGMSCRDLVFANRSCARSVAGC